MKVKIEVAAGISALISFLECRCHSGFGPPGPNPPADMDPPSQFGPYTKLSC